MAGMAWLIAGAGLLERGWVCCILTVAFGSAGADFGPSLGRLIRAVSFFGEAGRTGGAAIPDWPGAGGAGGRTPDGGGGTEPAGAAGFKGMVGLPVSGGGFGGVTPLSGFVIGAQPGFGGGGGVPESGFVTVPEGAAGAGAAGAGAGAGLMSAIGILEVSFFGASLDGAEEPGTLIRTVSRFPEGWSAFGGSVIRMVSFFVESSSCVFC